MKRKFIIHIGPAKTGTSSLQEVLFEHRDTLLAHGYDYPGFGRHAEMQLLPGHHGIPAGLQQFCEMPPGVIENLAALPDNRTVIFSSENLAHIGPDAVRALLKALDPGEIEVVFYTRRWDHLLPSVWQELIKHGHSRTYLEFLNFQISAPMASPYLNYMNSLDPWANVLGPKRLRIFSYDTMLAAGDDIVTHFCREVLGVKLDRAQVNRSNVRQEPETTEILRVLNRLVFANGTPSAAVRYSLQKNASETKDEIEELHALLRPYRRHAPFCPPFVYAHIERAFLGRYGHRVENLAENGLLLMDRGISASPYISHDYLLEDGALNRFRTLLEKIGPFK